jgi:hypothetical protein
MRRLSFPVWTLAVALIVSGCTHDREFVSSLGATVSAPEFEGFEIDSSSSRLSWGGVVAPSLYRQADFIRTSRRWAAPGDSIKIGITPHLLATDTTAGRTLNTKVESSVGSRTVTYTGTWTILATHTGLPITTKRDSFFVARPPAGITWTYRGCAQTARTGANPSAWVCKVFVYTRPVPPVTPPDSVTVDSSGIKLARLLVTPGQLTVATGSPKCDSVPVAARWKDAGHTIAVDACRGRTLTAQGDTVTLNVIAQVCAYGQFLDSHWELATNSTDVRCVNEFPSVKAGTVLGAIYAPGEPSVRLNEVTYLNLDELARLGVTEKVKPGEGESFIVHRRADTLATLAQVLDTLSRS